MEKHTQAWWPHKNSDTFIHVHTELADRETPSDSWGELSQILFS